MARFKTGQEVVCINNAGWHITEEYKFLFLWHRVKLVLFPFGPGVNEIVTCDGYNDSCHMYLKEYSMLYNGRRPAYADNAFEPVVPVEVIKELLQHQPEIQPV